MSQITVDEEPVIIDNVFPEEFLKDFKKYMLGTPLVPWKLSPYISYAEEGPIDELIKNTTNYYFTHTYVHNKRYLMIPEDKYFYEIMEEKIGEHTGYSLITRAKANLYPSWPELVIHPLHVDTDPGQMVALFIPYTTDGKFCYQLEDDGPITYIDSIGNRMVYFRSHIKHAGSNCTDHQCRITVNFNYIL